MFDTSVRPDDFKRDLLLDYREANHTIISRESQHHQAAVRLAIHYKAVLCGIVTCIEREAAYPHWKDATGEEAMACCLKWVKQALAGEDI